MTEKPEKKKYSCAKCGEDIPTATAKSCETYEGLEGKYYCKTHKEEILREKGYVCDVCSVLVSEKAKEFSSDKYGKVLCFKHQKNYTADEISTPIEMIPVPSQTEALIVRPAMTPDDSLIAWNEFQELKSRVKSPQDVIRIQGKEYLTKSFWRKMGTFFNLTDEITTREIEIDKSGRTRSAYYEVKVTHPNGRSVVGIGFCSVNERSFAHPDHDIRATANTRAKNRAISDMIAGGEATAEEMSNA